ncbi:AAA family ATPase [Pelotomaculum terephthalicicum JT]|uniref:AAA family ATPase n=1 Tax=Pelotomaculum TaxID=191373 RepID=UPI0009D0AA14|nr:MULTISPECIES: ATP-binding protein [Pelotomaculum]MCG9967381.1 AAA family ATPase [Pelotomaculum terephthalicicum JT]OPX85913.1 MAG: Archaeal ATPase [Pelotomaculum sp. PtaB.Bin117]
MLFPLGGPVPESDIVGREDFIISLETRLTEGQSVMLAGPRRIGKTSIANEVSRRLQKKGFYAASVDFFRTSSKRNIAESIVNSCLENRTGIRKTLNAVWDRAKLLAGAAKIAVKVEDLELNIGFPKKEIDDEALLEYALNLPDVLAEKDHKRMVIVFDEFQDAGQIGGIDIYKVMRSHFQHQKNVAYLFLGSKEGMMQSLFAGKKHAFYRFATVLPIPQIPEEAWIGYITRKFNEKGIEASSDYVPKEIVRLAGGHPQDTMLISTEAYYTLLETGEKRLSGKIVRIAYERAIVSLTPVFDEILGEVGKKPFVREVLRRLAVGEVIYKDKNNPNDIKRAIDQLIMSAVIEKEGRGKYKFVEPMLNDYIQRNY